VCTDPALRTQVGILLAEAQAVCSAAGIVLTRDPAEAVEEAIREAFRHKPSMLQDVLARRATEIDVLNGGIADEGRRVGVATPAHDAMVALVHGLDSAWLPPGNGPEKPWTSLPASFTFLAGNSESSFHSVKVST
jgi:2-dehydropantoate 2-reductase